MDTSKVFGVLFIEFLLVMTFYFLYAELDSAATSTGLAIGSVAALVFPIIWIGLMIGVAIAGFNEALN